MVPSQTHPLGIHRLLIGQVYSLQGTMYAKQMKRFGGKRQLLVRLMPLTAIELVASISAIRQTIASTKNIDALSTGALEGFRLIEALFCALLFGFIAFIRAIGNAITFPVQRDALASRLTGELIRCTVRG